MEDEKCSNCEINNSSINNACISMDRKTVGSQNSWKHAFVESSRFLVPRHGHGRAMVWPGRLSMESKMYAFPQENERVQMSLGVTHSTDSQKHDLK